MKKKFYAPVTPGGTVCGWLMQETEQEAIEALMTEAKHMPYPDWEAFQARGYTIETCYEEVEENADRS